MHPSRFIVIGTALAAAMLGSTNSFVAASSAAAQADQTEAVTLILTPPNRAGLHRLGADHRFTAGQRAVALSTLLPSRAQHNQVAALLKRDGLKVTSQGQWTISASGPSVLIQGLFGTSKATQTASKLSHGLPDLPRDLRALVTLAVGGDDRRPVAVRADATADCQAAISPFTDPCYKGNDLRTAYHGSTLSSAPATKVAVATVQLSGWNPNDLATYATAAGITLAPGQYTAVSVDGASPTTADKKGGDGEVALDQEALLGVAPFVNQDAYFAPNSALGYFDAFARIGADALTARTPIVAASTSWDTGCEVTDPSSMPFYLAMNDVAAFDLAAGVTLFGPTGDSGAASCFDGTAASLGQTANFPGTSPEFIAVGGTNMANPSAPTESGWNELSQCLGATGGGTSLLWGEPSWQSESAAVVNSGATLNQSGRMIPDITADADPLTGYAVYGDQGTDPNTETGWGPIGGTSLATPAEAALLANEMEHNNLTRGLGDLHAALYGAPSGDFRDITTGSNGGQYFIFNPGTGTCNAVGNPVPGYSAGTGYDEVSGLGAPLWNLILPSLLNDPQVTLNSGFYTNSSAPAISITSGGGVTYTGWKISVGSRAPTCDPAGTDWSATMPTSVPLASAFSDLANNDGFYHFWVMATDGTSCYPAYGQSTLFLDTHAPTAAAAIGPSSPTSSSPVLARWGGSDPSPSSGLSHFRVTITRQAGASVAAVYGPANLPPTTTSVNVTGYQGWTYVITVTATDQAGNTSTVATAKYAVPVDDTHFAYSAFWSRGFSSVFYGGSLAYSAHTSATTSYTATARTYAVWFATAPSGGRAYVYIGGTLVKTVDLYASSAHYRVPVTVYSSSSLASRTVTVRVAGSKDAVSHGYYVWVDALQATV
jgi:hypothetical protein